MTKTVKSATANEKRKPSTKAPRKHAQEIEVRGEARGKRKKTGAKKTSVAKTTGAKASGAKASGTKESGRAKASGTKDESRKKSRVESQGKSPAVSEAKGLKKSAKKATPEIPGTAPAPPTPEADFEIGGHPIPRGKRTRIDLPIAEPYGAGTLTLPVQVVRGQEDGPRLLVTAALHGDEIIGVEIIRRLLKHRALRRLRGTVVALPVVNVYGFVSSSRYFPDRRDLNRCFPGSASGSLAARVAHLMMAEIVARCTHAVDLHSAAVHRSNLPQIRAALSHKETQRLARAFGAPVVIESDLRDGSLRQAVTDLGIPMLLYEGGEALRFDEVAIRAGLAGLLRVLAALEMVPERYAPKTNVEPVHVRRSRWVRAPSSGVLRSRARLGATVAKGEVLGLIADPTGDYELPLNAPTAGIVIGRTEIPLLNEGDAAYHIAMVSDSDDAEGTLQTLQDELDPEFMPGPANEPPIQ